MEHSGQALDAPTTTDDLAAFLVDNPEADQADETEAPVLDNAEEENPDEGSGPDEEEVESEEEETEAEPEQSSQKFKVTVKGEDGADQQIEVDQKELVAGYTRHQDYTRKTMELGERERQAAQVVTSKLEEGRNYYMQEAQKAHQVIVRLAGLRSDQEMAQLAVQDPAAWVQEQQRAALVRQELANLDQGMQQHRQQAEQQAMQMQSHAFREAWGVLGQKGIDKPKLKAIFDGVTKEYGIENERFSNVTDPRVVLVMQDAMKYRELAKKAKDAKTAPKASKLPAPRQNVPQETVRSKKMDQRFRSGRANTKDLASFLLNNQL